MREIKFRAWDKTNKWMDNEFSIHADGCIYQDARRRWDISDIAIETAYDDLEIMQFTGLLDKNGKEVYEGDILKLQYPLNYGFAGIHNKEIIVTISFESGCFWFTGEGYTDCNWHFYNEYEVVGNIYENPDLL